jgi:hypothetical protein
MRKTTFILLLVSLILTNCNNSGTDGKVGVETINVTEIFNLSQKKINLSEIADDFEYFRPEAKPGSYFSLMGISYIGPRFVILFEKKTSQLYAFKRDGKFIGKLGEIGSGPAEYKSFTDVFVLPEIEEIHIFLARRKIILRYNFDLKFIGEIKLDIAPAVMHVYQDKYYLCGYNDKDLRENGGEDLILRDPISFKKLKVFWKRDIKDSAQTSDIDYFKKCWFVSKQDTLFYAKDILGKIHFYKIFDERLDLSFILDYDPDTPENENKIPTFLNHLMFFGDYLLLGFQRESKIYTGYYNLKTKKLSNYEIINDFDKGLNYFPMGSCATSGYYSDDLKLQDFIEFWKSMESISSFKSSSCKFPDREKWLRETIPSSKEDNPWIMIVYEK